ncbi:MAG TPA: M20/M25/M40 family metallo-hydrolase [Planctomycetota bacterium]|nr:M20/M25/M40 family metallo-hydrolase [Planctomycetota bacterium]
MKSPLSRLLPLLLISALARAGNPPAGPQQEEYRRDVFALCSETMAGRGIGSAGGEHAIVYVADAMAALGLRPAVHGSFRQQFTVGDPAAAAWLPATACAVQAGTDERAVVLGKDACPFRFSADGKVAVEVVFAGHGLVLPELGIDDYAGLEVHGKAVLVLRGAPGWREPDSPFRGRYDALAFATKVANAARAGAAALLLVERDDGPAGDLEHERAQWASGARAKLPAFWLSRSSAAFWFVDGASGLVAAQRQVDGAGKGPPPQSQLRPRVGVRLQVAMAAHPDLCTANVIGFLPGAVEDLRGQYVVVGAHLDHLGHGEFASLAGAGGTGKVHPGADDNASGVAGLLELARRCRKCGATGRTIVFVAFGAEEVGQIGSKTFVEQGPFASGSIAAMVDLDMIGRGRSGTLAVYGNATGTGIGALVAEQARQCGLDLQVRDRANHRSDQAAFLDHGVPALLFTTGLHDQYHRPSDVPELVEVEAAGRILDLVSAVVQGLANGARPQFVTAKAQAAGGR